MKKSEVIREGYVMGLKKAQEILNDVLRENYLDDEYDYYDDEDDDREDDQDSEALGYDGEGKVDYDDVQLFFDVYKYLWFSLPYYSGEVCMYLEDAVFSLLKNGGIVIHGEIEMEGEFDGRRVIREYESKMIIKNWKECFWRENFYNAEGEITINYGKGKTTREKVEDISFKEHGLWYKHTGKDKHGGWEK